MLWLDSLRTQMATTYRVLSSLFSSSVSGDAHSGISVGDRGEQLAADYLRRQGLKILYRSYRSPLGEIDIIAVDRTSRHGKMMVFVEVKTWSSPVQGGPADAVDDRKQERLTRLALEFLKRHHLLETPARFDVVQVILEPLQIRHFPNAFEATGKYQWFS